MLPIDATAVLVVELVELLLQLLDHPESMALRIKKKRKFKKMQNKENELEIYLKMGLRRASRRDGGMKVDSVQ